jgi:radical SAM superfamily enzyme
LEVLAREIRQKERIQIGKEEVELSLNTNDMVLFISKRPDKLHKKFLDIINRLSKVAGYKINLQISVAFLYIYQQ